MNSTPSETKETISWLLIIDQISDRFDFNVFIVGKFSFSLQTASAASALPPGRVWGDRSDVLWKHRTMSQIDLHTEPIKHQWLALIEGFTDTSDLHAGSSQSSESRLSSGTWSLGPGKKGWFKTSCFNRKLCLSLE